MLVKTKNDTLSLNASMAREQVKTMFGCCVRITDIWTVLPKILGLEKFEIIDQKYVFNADFDAFLIDALISFKDGEGVNFTSIKEKLLRAGDFTTDELLLLAEDYVEEFIWGFFHFLEYPE